MINLILKNRIIIKIFNQRKKLKGLKERIEIKEKIKNIIIK